MVNFKDFKDIIFFIEGVIIVSIVSFALPLIALTLGRGGEEQQNIELFQIMGVWILIGVILIGILKVGELIATRFKNNEKVYRKIGWIGTILHDPEKGLLTNIKKGGFEGKSKETFILFRWMENPFLLFAWSIPFFSIISLILMFKKSLLTELPHLVFQQISPFAQGVLSVEPSGGEIFLPLAFLGLFISFMFYLENVGKLPKGIKWIFIMLSPFVYGLLWMGLHKLLHPDSEIALNYVYIFGVISAYLLILTGSIIPSYVFKDTNNLFKYLSSALKSNEQILAVTITIIFIYVLLLLAITLIFRKIFRKKDGDLQTT